MPRRDYVVVDTETTGLDLLLREAWEVAAIRLDADTLEEKERLHFFAAVDLTTADPTALDIGGFWQRSPQAEDDFFYEDFRCWEKFQNISDNALWVGIQPAFDADTVGLKFRYSGLKPLWYYKLTDAYDLLSAASGVADAQMSTDDLLASVGMDVSAYDRHTAMGDVRMTADMLRKALR